MPGLYSLYPLGLHASHTEVTKGTLTSYAEAYNATVKQQYKDTEVDLSWPDWQQQWFEQETGEEEEGMER